jgi:hypothetical protein
MTAEAFATGVDEFPPDFDESTIALFREVEPYTMTSKQRVLLCYAVSNT